MRESGFWGLLGDGERKSLQSASRSRTFSDGALLCLEGEPTTHVFILLSGWVKIITVAADGREMKAALEQHRIDLIVLDVMMPGDDGLTLCRNLRASGSAHANTPILMLTARGEDMDRIIGLEMGADDYVAKPFNPRELVARIQAVMRRQPQTLPGAPTPEDEIVVFGRVKVNLGTRVLVRDGED